MMKPTLLLTIAALLAIGCSSPAAPATVAPATQAPTASPAASIPDVPAPTATAVAATEAPAPTFGPDYTGNFGGDEVAGTVKWCGSTANPYWAVNLVSGAGENAFMAFDIPAGSTEPVQGEMIQPFMVEESNEAAMGTGQFVPGDPPHFIIVNNEGTHDITLKVGKFCASSGG